jgi:hypothetical protein
VRKKLTGLSGGRKNVSRCVFNRLRLGSGLGLKREGERERKGGTGREGGREREADFPSKVEV